MLVALLPTLKMFLPVEINSEVIGRVKEQPGAIL